MKKLFTVLVVVALCVSVAAWASGPTAGKYQGTINSSDTKYNGQPVTAEVKTEGNNTVATVTFQSGQEMWTWDGKTLLQQVIDSKTKQVAAQYGATATTPGTYFVNCKDKVNNICDDSSDSRAHWTIAADANTFTYTVFGVSKEQKADPKVQASKYLEIVFNQAK